MKFRRNPPGSLIWAKEGSMEDRSAGTCENDAERPGRARCSFCHLYRSCLRVSETLAGPFLYGTKKAAGPVHFGKDRFCAIEHSRHVSTWRIIGNRESLFRFIFDRFAGSLDGLTSTSTSKVPTIPVLPHRRRISRSQRFCTRTPLLF